MNKHSYFKTVDCGDVCIVNFLSGAIVTDEDTQKISDELFSLIDQDGKKKLLLKFNNVEFFGAFFLGKLVVLFKKMKDVGGSLVMCGINKNIYENFIITKLNRLFNIQEDERAALRQF